MLAIVDAPCAIFSHARYLFRRDPRNAITAAGFLAIPPNHNPLSRAATSPLSS
jgi:hypothetical protein